MSAKHHGQTPLLRLLARLGWQRDPDLWTVRCRDQRGRRARLIVALSATGIALASTSPEGVELTPLEVGRHGWSGLSGRRRDRYRTSRRVYTRNSWWSARDSRLYPVRRYRIPGGVVASLRQCSIDIRSPADGQE